MKRTLIIAILMLAPMAAHTAGAGESAETLTFAARPVEAVADGEDAGPVLYFELDGTLVELAGAAGDRGASPYAHALIHAPDGVAAPLRIDAPAGRRFDPDRVHVADDASVVVLPLVGDPARALLVEIASGRVLADLAGGALTFAHGRIRIDGADAALRDRLGLIEPRAAWRDAVWPYHHERVERARDIADALVAHMAGDYVDNKARRELTTLLATPPRPLAADILPGAWRVRSLQASADALFAYPYFRAEIGADDDGLWLRKTTGSQRRSGRLLPFGDGASLVFVGAATVNDEPERPYSRRIGAASPDPADSVGRLWMLGDDHLLLLLDAEVGTAFEVYELRRAAG